ncbi:MAG: DUF3050 domain-containing protein [Gammaproteobacteria bacterium]
MSSTLNLARLQALQQALDQHPVYGEVRDCADLRRFMAQHVYAVWDFMALLKSLQHTLAPTGSPWVPVGNPAVRRFINEIVLAEESDHGLPGPAGQASYISHFELYCQAMREIGADTNGPLRFVDTVRNAGLAAARALAIVPAAAAEFMDTTFAMIDTGKPQVVAAAMALGREDVIPRMFRALLAQMQVDARQAPGFHYYLQRHIDLDEGEHGPLALLMLDEVCAGDRHRIAEAEAAAEQALRARLRFWDQLCADLRQQRLRPTGS